MFKKLKLKTVSLILVMILLILPVFLSMNDLYKIRQLSLVQTAWNHLQGERSEKALLESALRASIGYGGMIHEFKNLILRKENIRIDRIHSHLGAAQAIIQMYEALDLNEKELKAIKKISATLSKYKEALIKTVILLKEGKTTKEIDEQVKVKDEAALVGLLALRFEVRKLSSLTPTKGRLIADIRANLGYGGMIHQFKNLVLRGDLNHLKEIHKNITEAEKSIILYRHMTITTKEALSLKKIELTLSLYRAKLKQAVKLIKKNILNTEIDKVVFVDDSMALMGLITLDREVASQISQRDRNVTLSLNGMKKNLYITFVVSLLIIIGLILFLLWLMNTLIINPMTNIAQITMRLSSNHLDTIIPHKNAKNEVGYIYTALQVFKDNALIQKENAEKVIESNQKLKEQLLLIERQKEKLHLKSEEINRSNQYKSEFIANMSHELRTPLNSVILLSSILEEEHQSSLDEDSLKSLSYINKGGHTLLQLVNDILDLAKIESGKMECTKSEVTLLSINTTIMDEFKISYREKGINLALEVGDKLPETLLTDYKRILQILRNLLSNALKFTEQGTVTIKITKKQAELNTSTISPVENWICFSVIDTGIGLTKEQKKVVFNPFKQIDGSLTRKQGGTGLGLTISQDLAKLLGGNITIESTYGKGSIFSLYIPIEKENTSVIEPPISNEDSKLLESEPFKTINMGFYIGNNPLTADDVRLSDLFLEQASSGKESEKTLKKSAYYDFIFLDEDDRQLNHLLCLTRLTNKIQFNTLFIVATYPLTSKYTQCFEALPQGVSIQVLHQAKQDRLIFSKKLDMIMTALHYQGNKLKIESCFKGKTVLIVDDNEANIFVIKKLLKPTDINILSATRAKAALTMIEEHHIDIVLMDIMMPEMNGHEAINLIRKNKKERISTLPIIALTAKAMQADRSDALMAGANSYVTKPINAKLLIMTMISG